MSEDDRAAKAARAKAMLKKRQQQKKVAEPAVSSPPDSRTISPPPLEEEKRDFSDIFSKDDPADTSWLNSLPRAPSPPSVPVPAQNIDDSQEVTSIKAENASLTRKVEELTAVAHETQHLLNQERQLRSQQLAELQAEKQQLLSNEQQTIALLVSEKTSLTAQLESLEGMEMSLQANESLLSEERSKAASLQDQVNRLQVEIATLSQQNKDLFAKSRAEAETTRERERELQLANGTNAALQKDVENHLRKVKELEERIQNDDRVERLERALKNAEDRADEMEFQLSKLKQTYAALKAERDEIDEQRRIHHDSEDEWRNKFQELSKSHSSLQDQMDLALQDKGTDDQTRIALQIELDSGREEIQMLKTKLTEAASEFASNARTLQSLQGELKVANRRAEDAERMQQNLQAEGTDLMRSLEEMRPKIVELTGAKLELADQVASLENTLRGRDDLIAELESQISELHDHHAHAEAEWQAKVARQTKEKDLSQANSNELQNAYTKLQEELASTLSTVHTLEIERTKHLQESARRRQEIDTLTDTSTAQISELSSLRQELDERKTEQFEEQSFLERAQNEIETLRLELSNKDAELDQLREVVSSPSRSDAPRSLDDEMLSTMKQQHSLEISTLHSRIRALETSLFDAEARAHTMQKQLTSLQEKAVQRSFSPAGGLSRPTSRTEMHRPPIKPRLYDNTLSPEARHKRKISLSMLKARIDSETLSRPPSRALSPLHEPSETAHIHHRPQFRDEAHVFWCHSCRGDLIVL